VASKRLCVVLAAALQAACTPVQLPRFEATLAANDSATAALGQWCSARHMADPPRIAATLVRGEDAPPPPDAAGLSGYRHVRLSCGQTVLSEAHNWYARGLLTDAMNRTLDTTDTPFGTSVAALGFRRERLGAVRGAAPGCPRATVLSHRARLVLPDGRVLALVVECYTPAAIAR
jgi:chorismate-pyruvate lyase